MIAADTSILLAYAKNEDLKSLDLLVSLFKEGRVTLPPVVLSEMLSDYNITADAKEKLCKFPLLDIQDGYWIRVGEIRSKLLKKKLKAKLPDSLIAQSCIDYNVPLLTLDSDFKNFEKHTELKLYKTQ